MKKFLSIPIDILGISTSVLCALHCSILPIMMSLGLLQGMEWMHNLYVEVIFLSLSLVFAFWALIHGYRNIHGNILVILLAALGFSIFILGHFVLREYEILLSTSGGILLCVAHLYNWNLTPASEH